MSFLGPKHKQWREPPAMQIDPAKQYRAVLETNKGEIEVSLFPGEAPKTVNNFVFLARAGFYDGVPFHRVMAGFMIQTGDPTGTGTGGPGYRFEDELPRDRGYTRGIVAMANAGRNTNGSQFFIVHQAARLQPNYSIFGQVTRGLDVVDAIANVAVRQGRSGERSTPTEEVRIDKVTIHEE